MSAIRTTVRAIRGTKRFNRFLPHLFFGFLLSKFAHMDHCSTELPFTVFRQIGYNMFHSPVDKFLCSFTFHFYSLLTPQRGEGCIRMDMGYKTRPRNME